MTTSKKMEDNIKNGRRPKKKMEDDKKNKMEDKPINQNEPNWL